MGRVVGERLGGRVAIAGGASYTNLVGNNATLTADADVVVMTTEVLRNMLYEERNLTDLAVVVLDEVHYLEDSFRGAVWEEVILQLPSHVALVALSATVSNSDELQGWIESVRGPTGVVVETTRPVELTNLYAVGDRRGDRLHVLPTLVDGRPNPEASRFDPDLRKGRGDRGRKKRGPWRAPSRRSVPPRGRAPARCWQRSTIRTPPLDARPPRLSREIRTARCV